MVDVSLLFIYVIANFTVAYASFRSLPAALAAGQYTDLDEEEDDGQEMKLHMALMFVVSASLGLVFLYFFLATLSKVMLIGISIVGCLAFIFLIEPYLESMLPDTLLRAEISVPGLGAMNWLTLIEMPLGVGIVILWLLGRGTWQYAWVFNDIIAFSICVLMISSVKIKDLKVATALLSGILFYDVFWVYLSGYFFQKNVMVTVAKDLDLPIKIVVPYFKGIGFSMIGLGDMVLPGLLTGFLLRFDRGRNDINDLYFTTCMVGYAMGLALCLLVLIYFKAAQPAMLYLSPCTLGCVIFQAYRRNEFNMLWRGDYNYQPIGTDDLSL